MIDIKLESIINYKSKKKSHSDYTYGGWYAIKDLTNNKMYIGKSIDYMFRIRQHIKIKNPKTCIDSTIKEKGVNNFKFFLIYKYSKYNVNFFNRFIEQKVEHRLITKLKTKHPFGYNISHYEQL